MSYLLDTFADYLDFFTLNNPHAMEAMSPICTAPVLQITPSPNDLSLHGTFGAMPLLDCTDDITRRRKMSSISAGAENDTDF
jgi:hypothetical protein